MSQAVVHHKQQNWNRNDCHLNRKGRRKSLDGRHEMEFPEDLDQYFQMGKLQKFDQSHKALKGYSGRNGKKCVGNNKSSTSFKAEPSSIGHSPTKTSGRMNRALEEHTKYNDIAKWQNTGTRKPHKISVDCNVPETSFVPENPNNLKETLSATEADVTELKHSKTSARKKIKHVTFNLNDTSVSKKRLNEDVQYKPKSSSHPHESSEMEDHVTSKNGNKNSWCTVIAKSRHPVVSDSDCNTDIDETLCTSEKAKLVPLLCCNNTSHTNENQSLGNETNTETKNVGAIKEFHSISVSEQSRNLGSCEESCHNGRSEQSPNFMTTKESLNLVAGKELTLIIGKSKQHPICRTSNKSPLDHVGNECMQAAAVERQCSLVEKVHTDYQAVIGYCEKQGLGLEHEWEEQDSEPAFPLTQQGNTGYQYDRKRDTGEKSFLADSWSDYDEQNMEVALVYAEAVDMMQKKKKSCYLKEP